MDRVGILGGTFNPPHLGHLDVALHALGELALDRVVLMPARMAPHKQDAPDPGAGHRMAMCSLLVQASSGLSACELELGREGPSYTVDTLMSMHSRHPGAELTFIVGADTALTLPSWRSPSEILQLCTLAVAGRSGASRDAVIDTVAELSTGAEHTPRFLDMPEVQVSSSAVREMAARGDELTAYTGAPVAHYIRQHGLYRQAPC